MGILFNTSTWRAPLLMIDSWLPPRKDTPARRAQADVSEAPRAWRDASQNRPQGRLARSELQPCHLAAGQNPGGDWAASDVAQPAPSKSDRLLERFVRAGWLGRHGETSRTEKPMPQMERPAAHRQRAPAAIAARRGARAEFWRSGSRVVMAGRINDVCDELDRLVAMEQQQSTAGRRPL